MAPLTFVADIVEKSYINGVTPVGTLPWWLLGLGTNVPGTATIRLQAAAAVWSQVKAFNQNPVTDVKDGVYRLYTRAVVEICCDGAKLISATVSSTDMEGGRTVTVYTPHWFWGILWPQRNDIYGSINMSTPTITRVDASTVNVVLEGLGPPEHRFLRSRDFRLSCSWRSDQEAPTRSKFRKVRRGDATTEDSSSTRQRQPRENSAGGLY